MMNPFDFEENAEVEHLLERAEQIRENAQRMLEEAEAFAELRHLLDDDSHTPATHVAQRPGARVL